MFPIPGTNFGPLLAVALCLASLAAPVAATIVLAEVTLTPPDLPLAPGQEITTDAGISIIPSGALTFASGHSLQMETDLLDARWKTVVLTDGIPADQKTDDGGVMFLNGLAMSYPTTRDVALEVTVSGTVPAGVSSVTLLNVRELGNNGEPVPGSVITIAEPISVPAPSSAATTSPATTLPPAPPSQPPTPAPTTACGGAGAAALAIAGIVGLARPGAGRQKGP